MSLLLIARKVWRYKLATLPILAVVVAGAFYVMAVKAPTYEASSTYILVNPPPPPTDAQIDRDPALGRIKSDNPYTRFSDQSVLVQVLGSRLSSEEGRRKLAAKGADPSYTAAPSPEFGFSAPLLQITGTGTSATAAVKTAGLVGQALTQELDHMQQVRGVDTRYRIKSQAVVAARDATLKASGKLRALVAVFGLGTILLFIVISVADAVNAIRTERARGRIDREDLAGGGSLEPLRAPDVHGAPPHVRSRVPVRSFGQATADRDSAARSNSDPEAPQWWLEARR